MGEATVDIGIGVQQCLECERTDDGANEPSQDGVLQPPERRDIGCLDQVLRGKSPGVPG